MLKLESLRTVRVLTVHGGAFNDPIRCTIRHHELSVQPDASIISAASPLPLSRDEPRYEALSWTWGDDKPLARSSLHIIDAGHPSSRPQALAVKPSLCKALQYVRNSGHDRCLWIDVVCINQSNNPKKDTQVAMMADIYRSAQNVCIWLGEAARGSEAALDFVSERVVDLGQYEHITSEPRFTDAWGALGRLMMRPWFSRRWVVQEISLARRATVYCGNRYVTWHDFETAVSLFETAATRISKLFKQSKSWDYNPYPFGDMAAMDAIRLVHVRFDLFRRHDRTRAMIEYRQSLSELVVNLTSFEAKEPHDTIYAVLALANDTPSRTRTRGADPRAAQVFTINYNQPFVELCKQFLACAMSRTERHNLDILCRGWAPPIASELPSWVTTTANVALRRRRDAHEPSIIRYTRQHADQLVGSKPRYNACQSQQALYVASKSGTASDYCFGITADTKLSLFVTGFVLDDVGQTSTQCQDGIITAEWFRLAGWYPWAPGPANLSHPPQSLWRTLVGDRDNKGRLADNYYAKALSYAVTAVKPGTDAIDIQRLARDHDSVLGEYLERVKAMVWDRRLFVSRRGGHLGLAPKNTQTGDCEYLGYHAHITSLMTDPSPRYLYPLRLQCPGHLAQDEAKRRPASLRPGGRVLCRYHDGWKSH